MRGEVTCRHPHRLIAWGVLLLGAVMSAGGCQPASSGSGLAAPATQDALAEPAAAAMSPEDQGPSSAEPASSERGMAATSTQPPESKKMDDLSAFATDGTTILASEAGDLNGDGQPDALVVLDPPTRDGVEPGKGAPRTMLLLIRDANGALQKAAQNDRIVPCSKCGGLLGDPFGYMRIDGDDFTLVVEGGSRQRWSSEYTFGYAAQSNDWYLRKVERGAYDQISEERVSKTFTQEDFGQVAFSDFDPSKIPEVVLP